jgi:hypothetical protein
MNLPDKPERVVGRRVKTPGTDSSAQRTVEDARQWRHALGGLHVPRGVFRFATHEAADEWLWKMITRPRPNH